MAIRQELKNLEGKQVKNTETDIDNLKKGKIEEVTEENIYKGDTVRATVLHGGNIPRTGVKAEDLLNGETDWKVINQ